MTETTFDKLKKIIDKELGIGDGRILVTPATRFDDLVMDNYEVRAVLVQIDFQFDHTIPDEELEKFVVVGDMVGYLDKIRIKK